MARYAAQKDRHLFEGHLRAYLDEMAANGSEVIPSDRTVGFYMSLFDAYISGDEPGVVVIDEDGTSIAGHVLPFDTITGKTATGWFTFVSPDARGRGLAGRLRALLRQRLVSRGFKAIAAGVDLANAQGRASVDSRPMIWKQVYGYEELR